MFPGREACRKHLDMARELKPSPARPGSRRQHSRAFFCNRDLDYDLYRKDVPSWVCEYQRIPPLINRVPVKIRRTHASTGVKSSPGLHKAPRTGHLPAEQIKLRTEDLQAIRGELSQIKAQVDSLLESLERMDQRRARPAGAEDGEKNKGPGNERSPCGTTEPSQEPRSTEPWGQMTTVHGYSSEAMHSEDQ